MMIIASFIKICGYKQTQDSQQFIMILGNQAYMKTATQGPSTWPDISYNQAYRAVDGNLNPYLDAGSCSHPWAVGHVQGPWWQVDLGAQFVVVSVNITNRISEGGIYSLEKETIWIPD